jgi:cell division septal protein FtsQ
MGRRWAARRLVWFVFGVIGLVVVIVWVVQHI